MKKLTLPFLLLLLFVVTSITGLSQSTEQTGFTDVPEGMYFTESIAEMKRIGVVNGYNETTFGTYDNITKIQSLAMILRLAEIDTSVYDKVIGQTWDYSIKTWAIQRGIVGEENLNEKATRGDMAEFIAKIYKLKCENSDAEYFTDIKNESINAVREYEVILGIDNGDGTYRFDADRNIHRADACVMLTRLLTVEKPDWHDFDNAEGLTVYKNYNLYNEITEPKTVSSYDDFVKLWEYLMCNNISSYTVDVGIGSSDNNFDGYTKSIVKAYRQAQSNVVAAGSVYSGIGSTNISRVRATIYSDHSLITLNLFEPEYADDMLDLRVNTFNQCLDILRNLKSSGKLTDDMTEKDKALAIYNQLASMLEYDYTLNNYGLSQVLNNHTAVCTGYTLLFNTLCEMVGIDTFEVTGVAYNGEVVGKHMWTGVNTDTGNVVYIDSCWGDSAPSKIIGVQEWFWTSREALETHENWRTFDE